jgi:hypothetical protein
MSIPIPPKHSPMVMDTGSGRAAGQDALDEMIPVNGGSDCYAFNCKSFNLILPILDRIGRARSLRVFLAQHARVTQRHALIITLSCMRF